MPDCRNLSVGQYLYLPKLSQCTSLKTQSIFRRFGLMLRPSSGSVIQNSTKNDTHYVIFQSLYKPPHHVSFLVEFCITDPEEGLSIRPKRRKID